MRVIPRLLITSLIGLVAAVTVAIAEPPAADAAGECDKEVERQAGADRLATAIALSRRGWDRSDTVVLATSDQFPDAIAATSLAARQGAPLLLTTPGRLSAEVAAEIARLATTRVTVVGGPAAIAQSVVDGLRGDGLMVDRIAGSDRYDTAARVAIAAGPAASNEVVVVSGERFPDAVSAGSLAALPDPLPILLTPRGTLAPATAGALDVLGATRVTIVGGAGVVSEAVAGSLRERRPVTRIGGADRYATSAAVAVEAMDRRDAPAGLLLATGQAFPDALGAAALAARIGGVVALVPSVAGPAIDPLAAALEARADRVLCLVAAGGEGAIADPVIAAIENVLVANDPAPTAPGDQPMIVLGAGDIGDCTTTKDTLTGDLLEGRPGTVITFGDNAYENGSAQNYSQCYDPVWGNEKARTRPAAGNHDYRVAGADGYFDYFGDAAGPDRRGWYSYDLGPSWRVIVLNSNCSDIGGCEASSEQGRWLRDELARVGGRNVLAYWHHPRFSTGDHGSDTRTTFFWKALDEAGADIVLAGHDHDYERFAPADASGNADPDGIRSFVVGTGGTPLRSFARSPLPITEVRSSGSYGVLQLELFSSSYRWKFLPAAGSSFTDSGSSPTR